MMKLLWKETRYYVSFDKINYCRIESNKNGVKYINWTQISEIPSTVSNLVLTQNLEHIFQEEIKCEGESSSQTEQQSNIE